MDKPHEHSPLRRLSRREVLQRGVAITAGIAASQCLVSAAGAAGAGCADPASESLRESLHYAVGAAGDSQRCSACAFFSAPDGKGCGNCQILSGPADATGHCDSWSAR